MAELTGYDKNASNAGGVLITSSTPEYAGYSSAVTGYGKGAEKVIAYASQMGATREQLIKDYGAMAPEFRKALAQKLKNAGYSVPVTGAYNPTVRDAFLSASESLSQEISVIQQADPDRLKQVKYDLDTYLTDMSTAGGGGATTRTYSTVLSKGDVAELLNAVKKDLTGYGATKDEIDYYYEKLRSKALKQPMVQTTTAGGQVTKTGFNAQQFLIDQISQTDAAKERKVLNAYDAFAQAFGINL